MSVKIQYEQDEVTVVMTGPASEVEPAASRAASRMESARRPNETFTVKVGAYRAGAVRVRVRCSDSCESARIQEVAVDSAYER